MMIEMNAQNDGVCGNGSDNNSDVEVSDEPDTDTYLERVPRGAELAAELSSILSAANELESLGLPSDPNDTYNRSRRAALRASLSSDASKLRRYKSGLDREVRRCTRNLDRIQADSESLTLEQTLECYSEAERRQQQQHHEAIRDRDEVCSVLAKVRSALRASPLGSPVREPQSHSGGLGKEVDGLLSLGSLRKAPRQR